MQDYIKRNMGKPKVYSTPRPINVGSKGHPGDYSGRVRLHSPQFHMDMPDIPSEKLSTVLRENSIQVYHKTGTKPKSKIPDNLPGVFD